MIMDIMMIMVIRMIIVITLIIAIMMIMVMMMAGYNRPTRPHILTGRCQLLPLAINSQTAHGDHDHDDDHGDRDAGYHDDHDDRLFGVPGHVLVMKQSCDLHQYSIVGHKNLAFV